MPDCRAEIRIHDDRWGVFTDRCRLIEGHDGDHRAPRKACEPVAYLGWADPAAPDGSEGNEFVCDDCMAGDHEACRREGGWPYQDTNERCGCHDSSHRLDNRPDGDGGQ